MGFQAGQIGRVGNETAAGGDDRLLPLAQIPTTCCSNWRKAASPCLLKISPMDMPHWASIIRRYQQTRTATFGGEAADEDLPAPMKPTRAMFCMLRTGQRLKAKGSRLKVKVKECARIRFRYFSL